MVLNERSPFLVTLFLDAKTRKDLIAMQVVNNIKTGLVFDYSPFEFQEGKWVTYYRGMLDETEMIESEMKKLKENR